MSNHGYVTTKKNMKKQDIIDIINELNVTHFSGHLTYETDKSKYFESFWKGNFNRQFWLASPRKFEIRHGGGCGEVSWWVGGCIQNAVANKFDGYITDDGVEGKWKPENEKYVTYEAYLEHIHGKGWKTKFPKNMVKLILEGW